MKNITVSVDDDLYHRARVCAAEQKSTISGLVKKFLARVVEEESEFDRLNREEEALRQRLRRDGLVFSATDRIARDDLHERHALR
jgi:post-segregation antitoxin (ccd killing protein)